MREGTAEQNSPPLAFFSSFGDCLIELGQQEQMLSTPVPDGSTGILLCAPLQVRGWHLWMPHIVHGTLVLAGRWWELPAAMVTFLDLYKLKDMGKRKERTMEKNRAR